MKIILVGQVSKKRKYVPSDDGDKENGNVNQKKCGCICKCNIDAGGALTLLFPPSNIVEGRYDRYNHVVKIDDKKSASRCKLCKKTTHHYCDKCNVNLCLVKDRNCFMIYHGYD